MKRRTCPICKDLLLVEPSGPKDSPVLMLGEFPGLDEVRRGEQWIGPAGEVLRAELVRAGLSPQLCRMTNLWMHHPSEDPKEIAWHEKQMFSELAGRKAVFLIGSDIAERILGRKISDVQGLRVKSQRLPDSVKVAVACVNPAVARQRKSTIGEIRLAIGRFAKLAKPFMKE